MYRATLKLLSYPVISEGRPREGTMRSKSRDTHELTGYVALLKRRLLEDRAAFAAIAETGRAGSQAP